MRAFNAEALSKSWIVQKINYSFFGIPLDHAHVQKNANIKGKGEIN